MTQEQFNQRFAGTPIKRSKYAGFLRNVCVVMGNSGDQRYVEPLRKLAAFDDAIVQSHARWALQQLGV